jgi:hypothetical protein
MVLVVTERPTGKGSLVEVLLLDPWRGARMNIQVQYDLASLGDVESINGPFRNPPRWMLSYKGVVSANRGDLIQPKEQKENREVRQFPRGFFSYGRLV